MNTPNDLDQIEDPSFLKHVESTVDGPISKQNPVQVFDRPDSVVSRLTHHDADRLYTNEPSVPWWNGLDPSFPKWRQAFDVGARTLASCLLAATVVPVDGPWGWRRMLDDATFYMRIADTGDIKRFFVNPCQGVRILTTPATDASFQPEDGYCEDLCFDSPFEPVNPRMREGCRRLRNNNRARLRLFSRRDGPRPTILAIHGFMADHPVLNECQFALPRFYRLDCNIAVYTLPFHGRWQENFSPFSGHGVLAGGISRLNEAIAQSIFDLRVFMGYLADGCQNMPRWLDGIWVSPIPLMG